MARIAKLEAAGKVYVTDEEYSEFFKNEKEESEENLKEEAIVAKEPEEVRKKRMLKELSERRERSLAIAEKLTDQSRQDAFLKKEEQQMIKDLTKKYKLTREEIDEITGEDSSKTGVKEKVPVPSGQIVQDPRDPSWVPIPGKEAVCYTVNGGACVISKDMAAYRLRIWAEKSKDKTLWDKMNQSADYYPAENNTRVLVLNGPGSGAENGAVEVRFLSGKFKGQTGVVSQWYMGQPK
jgi:hypothetical protein